MKQIISKISQVKSRSNSLMHIYNVDMSTLTSEYIRNL